MADKKETNDPIAEANRVDELASREPTTEQSARENAGITRGPFNREDMAGVTDSPNGIPEEQRGNLEYDPIRRGEQKLPGDSVPTTGDHRDRRNEETHL